ncbi:porin [Pantoea vagans]|uniref:porin n=1 Tax=Pantoea vagans TaxID=470934 RepID=UPI0032098189
MNFFKKNLLAGSIILITSATHAAEVYNKDGNVLDLYGKVDALHYFSTDSENNGDEAYARLGFKGKTQITDKLIGYGQWEYNFQANNSESSTDAQTGNKTRFGFAGLKYDNFGSFDYGRNYGIVYDAISWTDMLPEFGGDSGYTDNFMNGRATGVATYRNTDFFGLVKGWNFAAQYQGENDRTEIRRANGDGWGISSSYISSIGIGVVAAYSHSKRTEEQNQATYGHGDNAQIWSAAVKYDANNIYLAGMYSESLNESPFTTSSDVVGFANKAKTTEFVAQYQFESGIRPSLAYVQSKGIDIEGVGDADLYKYVDVGITYYFNKNMSAYADYKINLLGSNNPLGINTDNIEAVGLVYQF